MSRQQDMYLQRRANGATMHTAAATTGIGIAEARLIENDIARGNLTLPPPETAEERGDTRPAEGTAPTHQPKENVMARGDKDQQNSTEVKQPDFAKAVRIFRQDIKPAVEKAGEHSQEASTGYKAIKELGVNTRAAKFVFKLAAESEEKRNDVLRSVRGLLNQMEIGITDDLVSDAEAEDTAKPIVPTAAAERPTLATVN